MFTRGRKKHKREKKRKEEMIRIDKKKESNNNKKYKFRGLRIKTKFFLNFVSLCEAKLFKEKPKDNNLF